MNAKDLRERHRKFVETPDGVTYVIRKLRELDFVSKRMLLVAASYPEDEQKARAEVQKYLDGHKGEVLNDVLNEVRLNCVIQGVVGLAEKKGETWDITPLTVTEKPTEDANSIYYLDLGPHFSFLYRELQSFNNITPADVKSQDSFREGGRGVPVRDGESVQEAPTRTP